ncbi:SDR family NAD(P)-dependent oxidoreductase [Actinomycetota bacterium]
MSAREPFAPAVSIVTGGASGIGLALARALVARGGHVVIADLNRDAADRVATELSAAGPGSASGYGVDVADRAAMEALVAHTVEQRGRLDLMVNNAGILFAGPFEETTDRHWDTAIDVNLRGVVNGCRAAYPVMQRQGGGSILNTGSLAGLMPAPVMTPYTATKWAVVGFSQALRAEATPKGIRVSVLCPAYVETPLIDEPFEPTSGYAEGSFRKNIKALQPRLIQPETVAEKALEGLERDRAVIQVGTLAQFLSRAQRFVPKAVELGIRVQARR